MDAEGGIFPLAFCVAESECEETWMYFLYRLHDTLDGIHDKNEVVLLSDRQKGLINAVSTVFPDAAHGYCLRHLVDNVKKKFKPSPEVLKLIWKASKQKTIREYEEVMQEIKSANVWCNKVLIRSPDSLPADWLLLGGLWSVGDNFNNVARHFRRWDNNTSP